MKNKIKKVIIVLGAIGCIMFPVTASATVAQNDIRVERGNVY